MDPRLIKTEDEYEKALAELEPLMEAETETTLMREWVVALTQLAITRSGAQFQSLAMLAGWIREEDLTRENTLVRNLEARSGFSDEVDDMRARMVPRVRRRGASEIAADPRVTGGVSAPSAIDSEILRHMVERCRANP